MNIEQHTIERPQGTDVAKNDRAVIGGLSDVANAVGGSAGAAVTTAVAIKGLPSKYRVHVTPNQACFVSVTNKTNTGFNVVLTPTSGTATLAAGTFDVTIEA